MPTIMIDTEQRKALVEHGHAVLAQIINYRMRHIQESPALTLCALKRAGEDLHRNEDLLVRGRAAICRAVDDHVARTKASAIRATTRPATVATKATPPRPVTKHVPAPLR
jgi:hypothetical protein